MDKTMLDKEFKYNIKEFILMFEDGERYKVYANDESECKPILMRTLKEIYMDTDNSDWKSHWGFYLDLLEKGEYILIEIPDFYGVRRIN